MFGYIQYERKMRFLKLKKTLTLTLALGLSTSFLSGCGVSEYKTQTVDAVVIEKEYDPPETKTKTVTKNGKTTKKKVKEPAEYEVTIQYKNIEREFEDRSLYNQVKEGQTIKVLYKQGLNEEGKVVTENIELLNK